MKDEALMATELGKSYYSAAEARQALEGQKISYSAPNCSAESAEKIHWELSGSSLICGQDQCGGISNGQDTSGKGPGDFP